MLDHASHESHTVRGTTESGKLGQQGTEMMNGPVFQVCFSGLQPMVETGPGSLDLSASWLLACWTGRLFTFRYLDVRTWSSES